MKKTWILLLATLMMMIVASCESRDNPSNTGKYHLKTMPQSPMVTASIYKTLSNSDTDGEVELLDPDDPNVGSAWLTEITTGRQASTPLYFHTKKGSIQWTPGIGDAGVYGVRVTVSDGQLTDSADFTITVNKINKPPYIFAKAERINNGLQSKSPILRRP